MVDLWRWRFDFLLRRRSLLSRQLGGSGVYDPGVRGRSMMDLCAFWFLASAAAFSEPVVGLERCVEPGAEGPEYGGPVEVAF